MTPAVVALGAGAGAALRFWLAQRLDTARFPLGIWLANVLGSFTLGLLVGCGVEGNSFALLGVGFCGAFTTFSTFAAQTIGLGGRGGAIYAMTTIVAALIAAATGFGIGDLLN